MMEVNAARSEAPPSLTDGGYQLVHNGTDNPDTTSIIVTQLGGEPVRAGYEYLTKVRARYLNGHTPESLATSTRACAPPALKAGAEWRPSLVVTSASTMTLAWEEPRQPAGPAVGCSITGYRLYLSSDNGVTDAEVDAAQVRDKPTLHEHTLLPTNFAPADLGTAFILRLEARNYAGVLSSTGLAVVLADAPAAPASGPTADPARTDQGQIYLSVGEVDASDPAETGGSPVLSYSLEVDDG
jgi:hypothetical protein